MNWIGALVSRKNSQEYEDKELGVLHTERGADMELLLDWLSRDYWRFDLGDHHFDGASEGLCVLAGIDPENSKITQVEYGPKFLPGAIEFYGYSRIDSDEQWQIQRVVSQRLGHLRSLGLSGRLRVQKVLEVCVQAELGPPWLFAANDDFECAKRLPASLRTDREVIDQIRREASSKGGRARANKNVKTLLLEGRGKEEFDRLASQEFLGLRANSSNRVLAAKVADRIYQVLGRQGGEDNESLPELTTVQARVRQWLKKLPK